MVSSWIRTVVGVMLLGAGVLLVPVVSLAQPVDVPPTWGGDLLTRPRLTGSWWDLRDEMGKKGIVFDTDLLLTPQFNLSGGRDTGADFWGNGEYTLNLDTGKAGLWPGGFLKVSANTGFGDNVFSDVGAIVPVNTAALLPKPGETNTGLMNATFMQFLSPKFGLIAGKIFLLDGFHQEFTGDYRSQFLNTGLVIPAAFALVPISAYGGGIIALPWSWLELSAMAVDASGTPTNNDITEAFDHGATVVAAAKVTIKPFGLVGHHTVAGMWSDKTRLSIEQDPSNIARLALEAKFPRLADPGPILRRILERFFPGLLVPTQPLKTEDTAWAVTYGFDQYFWQPAGDPKKGIGMFFNFGASDGNANPIKYSYSVGVGGNGVVPGRPNDNFGVGWARTEFSDNFIPFLRKALNLGLDHEDAVEMYYNAQLTGWLNASLDLQVVNPGLQKTLGGNGTLKNVDTAVVGGVRLYVRF